MSTGHRWSRSWQIRECACGYPAPLPDRAMQSAHPIAAVAACSTSPWPGPRTSARRRKAPRIWFWRRFEDRIAPGVHQCAAKPLNAINKAEDPQILSDGEVARKCRVDGGKVRLGQAALRSVASGIPSMRITPSVGSSTPRIMLIVVVLPAPFGPSSPTISPAPTSNETLSTATVPRYCFRNPFTESGFTCDHSLQKNEPRRRKDAKKTRRKSREDISADCSDSRKFRCIQICACCTRVEMSPHSSSRNVTPMAGGIPAGWVNFGCREKNGSGWTR